MHSTHGSLVLLLTALAPLAAAGASPTRAVRPESGPALAGTARRALSPDPAVAEAAIAELRAAGYAGVDALRPLAIQEGRGEVLDRVCRQFDCASSGLYWHTDLLEAKAAAAAAGKPILSLRLLGRLDEELTCANSRFFRTTLYPDAAVGKAMRQSFVLHWESVRPVPKVTIDFGDGRRLDRTLTGNSAHYVLDAMGRPVDAIPGLYGASGFLAQLERGRALALRTGPLDGEARKAALREAHGRRLEEIAMAWTRDLSALGAAPAPVKGAAATRLATLEAASRDRWDELAERHRDESRLDAGSRSAARKTMPPDAWQAGRLAVTKAVVEDPMLRRLDVLERSIAVDGLRNEYLLHPKLHRWFLEGSVPDDVRALDERVYEELFLMPLSDPWLGLTPADAFSAITADGRHTGR